MPVDRTRDRPRTQEEERARIALMKSLKKLSDRLTRLVEMIIEQEEREQR